MTSRMETQRGSAGARRQRGFSLMEVLVAMLVLAIGLLGLASLQAQSLKFNHDSYVRSQATILAYEMMDKMRADPSGSYADGAVDPQDPNPETDCNLEEDADLLLDARPFMQKCLWLFDIQDRLPSGSGAIVPNVDDPAMVDAAGQPLLVDVTIMWSDRENNTEVDCAKAAPAGSAGERTFDDVNEICLVTQRWTVFP